MNNRPKKPPVNIKEVNGGNKEVKEKGPITYLDKDKGSKSKVNLTQLLFSVGLAVLISFLLVTFLFTSKDDALTLLDNQKLLESNQATLETSLATETGRIENIIATQGDFARKSEITEFSESITSLGSKIDTIEPIVSDHEDRLTSLEEGETGGVGGSLDYYLTDTTSGYRLHVKSSRSGIFIARITLLYGNPYSVGTPWCFIDEALEDFYQSVGDSRIFSPSLRLSHTGEWWEVVSISFYSGGFTLEAGEEEVFNVPFTVPVSGYCVYVEVLPSSVSTPSDGSNI